MADIERVTYTALPGGVGLGVFWFIWGAKGFWWGVLYGCFWPVWAGFHLAKALVQ